MKKIQKILIANRGEIACRIMATCKEMGIKVATIYAEDEIDLLHVIMADESYSLGKGPIQDTYLNGEKILEIALKIGADAIHPGYGFLSEKANFVKLVQNAGVIFIGPNADVMQLMGDKKDSKAKMQEWGIPVVPGYHGDEQDFKFLKKEAEKIGFPILIKAAAGGGGKGMRIVHSDKNFEEALAAAQSEGLKSFKDSRVILEKYVINPRHIEVQVFSDSHGNHLHMYERECSIQRRYQKIVEESPSTALNDKLRSEITKSAVLITKKVGYLGAGTIEFILDQSGKFYFLEMNTRLQVEHPVTEMITGLDLVRLQILVAQGEKLPIKQDDIEIKGHAIEVRIYAEDPDNSFFPTTGKIQHIGFPQSPRIRFDVGLREGNIVGINYDPMIGKLIVWDNERDQAIEKMKKALSEIYFVGVKNNINYLKRILSLSEFKQGMTFTNFVEIHSEKLRPQWPNTADLAKVIAVSLFQGVGQIQTKKFGQGKDISRAGDHLTSLRNC